MSRKLVNALADLFPDSLHVQNLGMAQSDDRLIWEYAKQEVFAIISKDSDFYQRSHLFGSPPKVIWFKRGNCSTKQGEFILRNQLHRIEQFSDDPNIGCLILY
ncbi:MAG: DUF5615 family PIN-like protein [Acidobacteriota bacterium]